MPARWAVVAVALLGCRGDEGEPANGTSDTPSSPPTDSADSADSGASLPRDVPADFVFGAATAGFQVDMGCPDTSGPHADGCRTCRGSACACALRRRHRRRSRRGGGRVQELVHQFTNRTCGRHWGWVVLCGSFEAVEFRIVLIIVFNIDMLHACHAVGKAL